MQLSQLCKTIEAAGISILREGPDLDVHGVASVEEAGPTELTFISNPKYVAEARTTRAAAVIAKPGVLVAESAVALRSEDPYAAVTLAIIELHGHRKHPQWGISEKAEIDPSARIGRDANIAAGACVAANAVLGERCTLYPGSYVGEGARLGDDCVLFPNTVVYNGCVLGDRVVVHAGSVIGQDGVGFAPVGERWLKIPQLGRVVIGDDVEIGANCAVDRAALGATEIGSGTKLGNLVIVAHGAKVGANCMFVGQVGVAGSARIGKNVILAGQVGVVGHLEVGDRVRAAARSVIMDDIPPDTEVMGMPAVAAQRGRRILVAEQQLPELIKRVRALEREVAELRAKQPVKKQQ